MLQKKWQIKEKAPEAFLKKFSNYADIINQLLFVRGLSSKEEIESFLSPDYKKDSNDPFLLKGMSLAIKRISRAIENKDKIAVYGDYDTDGVTSTVILVEMFKLLGMDVMPYIPDRAREGYGLNEKAVQKLIDEKVNLIITVDCGITGIKEVDLASAHNVDVIITDHHHVPENLPNALAIINPKQKDDKYPFKDLAGVGVAFKLVQALVKEKVSTKIGESFEKWSLDLVAMGTIADVCPLIGENRTFVERGLVVLKKTKKVGLKVMMNQAKIDENKINADTIGYQISPRINAAGRIDHANTAYELLITDDKKEAARLAEELDEKNIKRQKLIEAMIKKIKKEIDCADKRKKIIFAYNESWATGLLGVAAGKLREEFSKPCLIFNRNENESTGSGRSIPCFNLIESISECKDLLVKFGGHSQAAGLTIENNKIGEFEKKISKIADEKISLGDTIPIIEIDTEIDIAEINNKLCKSLEKFMPFGAGNSEPIFLIKNLSVVSKKLVGGNSKHLKLQVCGNYKDTKKNSILKKYFNVIGFNFKEFYDILEKGDIINLVCNLCENRWNGEIKIDLKITDIKKVN